jgi:hypothetical protein
MNLIAFMKKIIPLTVFSQLLYTKSQVCIAQHRLNGEFKSHLLKFPMGIVHKEVCMGEGEGSAKWD